MQSLRRTAAGQPCRLGFCFASRPVGPLHGQRPVSSATLSASHAEQGPASLPASPKRRDRIRDARPFSDFLTDTFHRQHDYLRISVTERCNLRCLYCMPEEGVPLSPDRNLLTTPEILLLSSVFVSQGVTKIRLTGGEPTVRRDILPLMHQLGQLRPHGLKELCITTNGIALHRKLESMIDSGLTGVNLSLDTLDPWQFQVMTRRRGFDAVLKSIDRILELNRHGAGVKLKINCVVIRGINDREMLPFVELTREKDLEVRFIEYMPFDGNKWQQAKMFSYAEMLDVIRERHPELRKACDEKNDTSKTWQVPGFAGRVGFITSMTHNFCGTCNRLRLTGDGSLKVCLFGNAEVSLRDILRRRNGGEPIDEQAYEAMKKSSMDADRQDAHDRSLAQGLVANEAELLEVIGMAVKRKKAKHAGIGELEHMKNRPMILIDAPRPSSSLLGPTPLWARPIEPISLHRTATTMPGLRFYSGGQRYMSVSPRLRDKNGSRQRLTHVAESGSARMVSISDKEVTSRLATAVCCVRFSSDVAVGLIRENQMGKGDVLGVSRVAGIMAAKRTSELIPLCHPIALSRVGVEVEVAGDREVRVQATVACEGRTGVEMEALTAASTAALTVYDMCKAVDKRMEIGGLRVVLKEGGRSGRLEWGDDGGSSD